MSYPKPLLLRWRSSSIVVSRSGEVNSFTSRFDNAFFAATNTNTHEGISLFSINSLHVCKVILINPRLRSSSVIPWTPWRRTLSASLKASRSGCLLVYTSQVVIRNNQQYLHVREVRWSLSIAKLPRFEPSKPNGRANNCYCVSTSFSNTSDDRCSTRTRSSTHPAGWIIIRTSVKLHNTFAFFSCLTPISGWPPHPTTSQFWDPLIIASAALVKCWTHLY